MMLLAAALNRAAKRQSMTEQHFTAAGQDFLGCSWPESSQDASRYEQLVY